MPLGLYIVKGDNMCALPHPRPRARTRRDNGAPAAAARCSAVVGEVDQEEDENLDLSTITAPPLKTIWH